MASKVATASNGGLAEPPSRQEELDLSTTTFKRLHPRTYLERFLDAHIREDGRSFSSWRPTSIVSGAITSADGSCLVRLGVTTVVAGIKAEIAKPDPARGTHGAESGWLVPNIEFSPLSSTRGRPGPPSEEAQLVCDRLTDILTSSVRPVLDPASLCIEKEVTAWCLYLDITVISNDGNVLDAAVLAAVGALQDCRLPHAAIDEASGEVLCSRDPSLKKPLSLLSIPSSSSFGVYEGTHLLTDPTGFEGAFTSSSSVIVGLSRWTEEGKSWRRSLKGKEKENGEMEVDDEDGDDLAIHYLYQVGRCRAVLPPDEAGPQTRAGQLLSPLEVTKSCIEKAKQRYEELQTKLDAAAKSALSRNA